MVLRIYWILIAVAIIGGIIDAIFRAEQKKADYHGSQKYVNIIDNIVKAIDFLENCYIGLFIIYNVFVLGYCIVEKHFFFMITPSAFLLFIIFIIISEKIEAFSFLTEIIAIIAITVWFCYTLIFSMLVIDTPINEKDVENKADLVNTIDILEFTQAPYNNITGRRYYIKSAPSSAYYYEVRTENGGTTTKVIDGSNSYVEKFESDEYMSNPHIDVYRNYTIEHYKTWYGNEVTKEASSSYSYYIYTPVNSMFYEE